MSRVLLTSDGLATWVVSHARHSLVLAVIITLAAFSRLPRLQFDDDFRNLFRTASAGSSNDQDREHDLTCLVMIYGAPLVTAEGLSAIYQLHQSLDDLAAVAAVHSMLDARQPRRVGKYFLPHFPGADADADRIARAAETAVGHPMLDGQLLSADQESTLLFVQLDTKLQTRAQIYGAIEQVKTTIATNLQETALEFELTGLPVLRMALADVFTRDQWTFNVGGAVVAMLVSAMVFRSALATLIILLGPVLGVVWTMATMAVIGEPLSIVNGMVGPLTLAIGLTAAVHMMYHYRHQCRLGKPPHVAADSTIRVVVPACGWAALTTILGFLTLGVAQLETIRHFGFVCAAAVALTFLAVVLILPALCLLLKLDFSRSFANEPAQPRLTDKVLSAVAHRIVDRPRTYCLVGGLLILLMLAVATQLKPAIAISEALPSSGHPLAALRLVEQRFDGALPITLVVHWAEHADRRDVLDAMVAAHEAVDGPPYLSRPLSLVSLLRSLPGDTIDQQWQQLKYVPPEIIGRFFDPERHQSYIFARCEDVGTHTLEPMIRNVEDHLCRIELAYPGFDLELTEVVVESVRTGNGMIDDLAKSLLCAVPLIALVLIFTFRSWRLGLVSIIPNVFPLAATAACIVLLGWNLRLFTVSLFAIFFGIAVDDTIHIMLRFRRELAAGASVRDAILTAMQQVGPAVITTTMVLSAGLSVLMVSEVFGIRRFGFLFCCGLFWALVGDLILLPACLAWFFAERSRQDPV